MKSILFEEALRRGAKRPTKGSGVKILEVLGLEFPNPLRPKKIAEQAGLSHEATKKWLKRNTEKHVESVGDGFYRASATLHLLRRVGFEPVAVHAVVGTVKMSLRGGRTPSLGDFGIPHKSESRRGDWNGRVVTVQPMAMEGCYRVTCRATLNPMPPGEFIEFVQWLESYAGNGGQVILDDFDLNTDAEDHRIRMAGVQSVTMGEFGEALLKIYNKKEIEVLRFEACFHRARLTPREAVDLMRVFVSKPYELSEQALSEDEKRDVV